MSTLRYVCLYVNIKNVSYLKSFLYVKSNKYQTGVFENGFNLSLQTNSLNIISVCKYRDLVASTVLQHLLQRLRK